jgi:DNA-binding NarL/FixJ family response regulator
MSDLLHPLAGFEDQPLDAFILCANQVLALGIQYLLDDWSDRVTCHRLDPSDDDHSRATFMPDILILAPQNWQEMAGWLPALRRRYRCAPWLLFTESRIAGLFLSLLEHQPCTLVSNTASPEQLRSAALSLAAERAGHLRSQVLSMFNGGYLGGSDASAVRPPSAVEVQCGCAVSLGLSNRQIASILHLSEATIKSHLYRLGQKLGRSTRQEVGKAIHRGLSSSRHRTCVR